ncbi:hypothetical protein TcCL_Unassigned06040 [Trypanosoma cruzi]|nr:hypothetical protein TcCL_Unassigned06040 [Trypanosoma cruzi]
MQIKVVDPPAQFPIMVLAETLSPSAIENITDMMFIATPKTANASGEIEIANNACTSKAHHSEHTAIREGIPTLKNVSSQIYDKVPGRATAPPGRQLQGEKGKATHR